MMFDIEELQLIKDILELHIWEENNDDLYIDNYTDQYIDNCVRLLCKCNKLIDNYFEV